MPPEQRERAIVRAAIALFAEQGFGAHTRELAKRLGITQPLLYRYFPSKEALIERVYEEVFLRRWDPGWEDLLDDATRPLQQLLTDFYRDYARAILNYEWIRLFLFAGLRGVDYNARYQKALRERIFSRVIRLLRAANRLPPVDKFPIAEGEYELVWSLHASIFYLGVRKWVYGLPIPTDIDADIGARVTAFLHGAPAAMRGLAAKATTGNTASATKGARTRVRMVSSKR
jgi:AcrR family transcriptional regulator